MDVCVPRKLLRDGSNMAAGRNATYRNGVWPHVDLLTVFMYLRSKPCVSLCLCLPLVLSLRLPTQRMTDQASSWPLRNVYSAYMLA